MLLVGAPRQSCWPARAPWRSAIEKLLLAEAPWRLRYCWQEAAGKEDARLHREAAAGRGAAEQDAAGREEQGCIKKLLLAKKTQGCIGKMLMAEAA